MRADDCGHRIGTILKGAPEAGDIESLRALVAEIRPTHGADPAEGVRALRAHLEGDPSVGREIGRLLMRVVESVRLHPGLAESGVGGGEGFLTETFARIGRRLFPPRPDDTDVRDVLRRIFDDPDDHRWVAAVPDREWRALLGALGLAPPPHPTMTDELAAAIRVLTHHAASLGLQPQITERIEAPAGRSPFLHLGDTILRYLDSFDNDVVGDEAPRLADALREVERAHRAVERIRSEKSVRGTSIWLTSVTSRLLAILRRLDLLLHLTKPERRDVHDSVLRLVRTMLHAEQTRDHLVPHLRASADLLVLQVVEHAARKGSKYITTGRADYGRFLLSSLGGGLIVALFGMAKVGLGTLDLPLGVQAIAYGLNYSVCFVLIYLTGATLATKQPAMTANTLARSLGRKGHDLEGMEELIVRVWRSQFISFVGNLAMALPVAFVLSLAVLSLVGTHPVDTSRAESMLEALHPWRSGTVAYAAIAGVLLFSAGLVSGWVDNWSVHRRLRERLAQDRRLIRLLGGERVDRMAAALDRNLGAVLGNVFLGFGLGSLGTVGVLLGLPLDIRHIAFASAELGIALEVLGFGVSAALLGQVALGVALIGLLNFVVSFGMSLGVALESRRVGFRESRRLLGRLLRRLRSRPVDWFFPPREAPGKAPS